MNERIAAVIVAAGQATRFGAPKILTPIAGRPAIEHVLHTFASVPGWSKIILVANPESGAEIQAHVGQDQTLPPVDIITGGERRQDSVRLGIEAIGKADVVVIHDGARPLVTRRSIEATLAAIADGADAAVAAVPVVDTLKRATGGRVETVDRSGLWRAQTPQAFRVGRLRAALSVIAEQGLTVTDEAMAIELTGGKVTLVPGDEQNIKLTTPGDALVLEALAVQSAGAAWASIRTGIGYDVHKLIPGRPLVLGGVEIPFELGLEGHSDADVLLHAIADAVLGASAQGDIGRHFPPSDEAFRGISSFILLQRARDLISSAGFEIVNVDATVIAEEPRIGPFAEQMRARIADALRIDPSTVGLKATTNEGLGFAGRREGIAAMAVATVRGRS